MTAAAGRDVPEAAERSWWIFRHDEPKLAKDPRMSHVEGYRGGYRDAIADTVEFSSLKVSIDRLSVLLEALVGQRAAALSESEQVSAYWRTREELATSWAMSNANAEERAIRDGDM